MARERIVHDEHEPCPYLPGRTARMPLRWQLDPLSPEEVDRSLDRGDRRVGQMLYQTSCPECQACEPLRIPVAEFRATDSQRRVMRKNKDVRVMVGPPSLSDEKLALFNRHKLERGLARREQAMTKDGYAAWFLRTCSRTVEMQYLVGERLVGVGIVDLGARSLSSVYFYFDPDEGKRSLGTFSVLAELAWWRRQKGRYHYLGLYVEDCRHLVYKARFFPHERRVGGVWTRFPSASQSENSHGNAAPG
jgi:arginyl-tRNA--protein-N-Asp/Glu arginylyltransferase